MSQMVLRRHLQLAFSLPTLVGDVVALHVLRARHCGNLEYPPHSVMHSNVYPTHCHAMVTSCLARRPRVEFSHQTAKPVVKPDVAMLRGTGRYQEARYRCIL